MIDARIIDDLIAELDTIRPNASTWSLLIDGMVAAGCEAPYILELEIDQHGCVRPGEVLCRGFQVAQASVRPILTRTYVGATRWGLFDPTRVEKAQRDRFVLLELARLPSFDRNRLTRLGLAKKSIDTFQHNSGKIRDMFAALGTPAWWLHRALPCDDLSLLAQFGNLSPEAPHPHARRQIERLAPHVRRRLTLDRRLGTAPLLAAALDAALDAIGAPAWIEDDRGHVRHENAAFRSLDRHEVLSLRDRQQAPNCVEVTRIVAAGLPGHRLVIARPMRGDHDALLAAAARAWELTTRQAQVLRHIVDGAANKTIAARLGCAPHTVELHVTEILARSHCESRAQLVARFWREEFRVQVTSPETIK